jgi:hypothetical protein
MSDIDADNTPTKKRPFRHRGPRKRVPRIVLPDGRVLVPREDFSKGVGVDPKTARRWDLPTVYIANIAYVEERGSLEIIGDKIKRRSQPTKKRRGR